MCAALYQSLSVTKTLVVGLEETFGTLCMETMEILSLNLSVQSSQWQHVVAAEPDKDGVYPGLETLQAALCGAAGCGAGPALPGSALLLSALRAQPQALQQCWIKPLYVSVLIMYYTLYPTETVFSLRL